MRSRLSSSLVSRSTLFHLLALMPLALLLWDVAQGNLSANPYQDLLKRTGSDAMILLLLSLAATPVFIITGFKEARKMRKPLGLYAFLYTAIHVFVYVGLDYAWDWGLIGNEILTKPAPKAGTAAFIILLLLTITSTKSWQKRLKKNWIRLHKWVYAAGVLIMLHFIWVQKADITRPLLWTALLLLLLSVRIPAIRRWFSQRRSRRITARYTTAP